MNAREALSYQHRWPTPISVFFVADRLIEIEGAEGALGICNEVAEKSRPPLEKGRICS